MKNLKVVMNVLPAERRSKIDARAGELIAEEMTLFDDYLKQEGILEEVEAMAVKQVLAWQKSRDDVVELE